MPGLDSLLYAVTAKISDPYSPECWHKLAFESASQSVFSKASNLYDQGHRDYAFFELFRFIETQLRVIDLAMQGVLAKVFQTLAEILQLIAEGKTDEVDTMLNRLDKAGPTGISKQQKVERIINDLRAKDFIDDGEMHMLHALRNYRNEVGHSSYPALGVGMYEALILLTIPTIRSLEEVIRKVGRQLFPSQPTLNQDLAPPS